MSISLQCAECKTNIEVSEAAAGKYAKCRKCGNLMRVPGEAASPYRHLGGEGGSSLKWLAVGAAAVMLTAGAVFVWSAFSSKPARVVSAAPVPASSPVAPAKAPPPPEAKAPALPKFIPDSPMKDALLDAPENSLVTGAIVNPSSALKDLRRGIDELTKNNPAAAGTVNLGISQLQAQTGLDLNNTQSLGIAGLDLSKPLTFSFFTETAASEKMGFALGASLTDAAQFRSALGVFFQKARQPMQRFSQVPELYQLDASSCIALEEKRAFIIVSDPGRLVPAATDFLQNRTKKPLRETEQMAVSLHGAEALSSSGALYADLPRILALQKGESVPLAKELRGLAFGMSGSGGWFLQLNRDAALYQLLKPGPSPRALLERFEPPLASVCVTLEEPVRLLQHTLHASKQSAQLIRMDEELRERTGLGLVDLENALKNCSLGLLLFKGNTVTPFSGILFIKPGDVSPGGLARVRKLLGIVVEQFNGTLARPGQGTVIPRASVVEVDGTLFATTDTQLLLNYQRNSTPRWKVNMSPDDIVFLEYRAGDTLEHLKRVNPQLAPQNSPIAAAAVFGASIKRMPEGIRYYSSNTQVDIATISAFAAVGIPSLLRSRMAANQAAAAAMARAYHEAQEIYKREDRDGDGVLEYAQSLNGEFGLGRLEMTQGVPFLDDAFVRAEGNPGDTTAPKAGYCIKLLKGQGERAKGGRMNYLTGKNMILGHAAVFYPKSYDSSGRSTFVVNKDGVVYEADLGIDTHSIVEFMTEFNPGPGWIVSE